MVTDPGDGTADHGPGRPDRGEPAEAVPPQTGSASPPEPEPAAAPAQPAWSLMWPPWTYWVRTTLAVVATDVTLDKAGAARLAVMGHDGLARAIVPVHTLMDGDTIFGLATCARPAPSPPELFALQAAAAEVVTRAVVHALLAAETVTTPAGTWPGHR